MIAGLFSMLLGGGAQRLVSTVFGDRAARERYAAEEQMAVQTGFQTEFSHRDRRTWWDSFVDGNDRENGSQNYAAMIATARRTELGDSHRATKTVMRWIGASERTVKH